ncbi:MAG: PQQ-dependent sugar dehydrogenase [Cecembia sp.]
MERMKDNVTKFSIFTLFLFLALACLQDDIQEDVQDDLPDEETPIDKGSLAVMEAFPNLTFNRPLDFQHAGDGSNRVFVVEQRGVISVFSNDPEVESKNTFLDISPRVSNQGNEEGLLGLAFHPDYENNGYFYVNYSATSPRRTVISRFQVSATDPNQANVGSELVLLEIEQPFSNHNGGQMIFGSDGYLYYASGDGGSGGDPQNHGQRRETMLGAILRIDINQQSNGRNYAIPGDNPFAGNNEGFAEEIYAYGLRNPWRMSFDSQTGILWAADVGQSGFEEINIIENGGNYGWRIMEGTQCFNPSQGCNQEGLELPIWEYDHSNGDRSITGGFVYRGEELDDLKGHYVYGDFVSGRIWALNFSDLQNPINTEIFNVSFRISSFGIDENEELYICGFDGKIYKIGYE